MWYRTQMMRRLSVLRELVKILELLMGEVRFGKATLPECCKRLAMRLSHPFGKAMEEVYLEMKKNDGVAFAQLFYERMNMVLMEMPLTNEDRTQFFQFVEKGSYEDGAMQLRSMEQSKEELEETIHMLATECVEKGRVVVSLGAMSGILLVIVLL